MCCVLLVVLYIICCVSQYCVVPTIKCKFFQQNLIIFHNNIKFILCKLLMFFSSDVGFSMSACSVRLVWPSLWWSRCVFGAVMPSFHWPDWAVVPPAVGAHGHVMQQTIKIVFTNRFSQFCCEKFSNQQAISTLKNINKMFNKTIWIPKFFSYEFFSKMFTWLLLIFLSANL